VLSSIYRSSKRPEAGNMPAKKKILVVDDSKTALMMQSMILKRESYEAVTAVDGEEGVAKALAEKPDLILLDVVMPKLNGFEVLKRLRAEAATRETPILLVTTRGETDNVEAGYAAGCSDYVTKPIDGTELLAKIKHFLGGE
jgi:DNA-binding response OmpR family regulator